MKSRSKRRRPAANMSPSQRKEREWSGLKPGRTASCPNPLIPSHLVRVCAVCLTACPLSHITDKVYSLREQILKKAVYTYKTQHVCPHQKLVRVLLKKVSSCTETADKEGQTVSSAESQPSNLRSRLCLMQLKSKFAC